MSRWSETAFAPTRIPRPLGVVPSVDDSIPESQAARPQSVQSYFGALTSAVEGLVLQVLQATVNTVAGKARRAVW
jgi:hypothetical protein